MTETILNTLLDDIATNGWGRVPQFLSIEATKALRQDLRYRQAQGQFQHAAVGKGKEAIIRADIRGDETLWWKENDLIIAQKDYYQHINTLQIALNEAFYLGLKEFECQYACYPTGAFYHKHLDSFRKNNNRLISCILYLNKDWLSTFGGELRVYHTENELFTDGLPIGGTLVCLRSDVVWHEVLPATQARYSIAGWLRKTER
jgi:SM-20-related protein